MPTSWIQPNNQNSLIDTFAQAEQLKAYRGQNALNDAKIAELPYARERAEALNTQKIKASEAQTAKYGAETQGSQLENTLKTVQLTSQLLSQARDEGSYQFAVKKAASYGLDTSNMPPSYDPAQLEQIKMAGVKVEDQIKARLDADKFTEQQKQSGIDNSFQQGNLNVAQGHLGVSQAGLGERQRHNQVMENRPQSGFSMSYDAEGRPVMSYGTPAKNELEKKVINEEDALARLSEIEKSANSENLTYQNQAKNALLDIKGKLGGQMSPEQATFRDSMTDTRQVTLTNLNKTIHELSGTAMGVKEAERIMATMPNMDDAPDVFDRKLLNSFRMTREAIARHKGALGAQPGAAAPPPNTPRTPVTAAPREEFDAMPMPGEFKGRGITAPNGIHYTSDGKQWVRD